MTLLVGLFDRIVPGPFLSFAFQCGLWFTGLAILMHLGFEHPTASLLIAAISFWPPILVHLAVVQKDTQMAAALLLATAMLALFSYRGSGPWTLAVALVALLYALGCRYNAIPAVLPLLFLWAKLALGPVRRATLVAAAASLLIAIAWTGALQVVAHHLTRGKSLHVVQELFLADLAGMSTREGVDLFPAYLHANRPDLDINWIRSHARTPSINDLVYSPDAISWDGDLEQRRALRASGWHAIVEHPVVYASFRLDLFGYLLGFDRSLWFPVFPHSDSFSYPMRINTDDRRYRSFMTWVQGHSERGLWFRTWIYCLLLAAAGAIAALKRNFLGLCFQLSAWLYLLSYLLASPNADFRYAWWVIVAALVMPALAVLAWREGPGREVGVRFLG